mmetsp:Transcript_9668/g.13190  ORF Transcript_9668/g.13190 Transcript_9668/m.13190 type:complete len:120 (+) Transcript_9668:304-663(+)
MLMRITIASDGISKTTASFYKTAWLIWWVGNLLIWGILAFLWPFSYNGIGLEAYLFLWKDIALLGGYILAGVNFLFMLISAFSESKAWLYVFFILLIDGAGSYGSILFFEDAEKYYLHG